VVELAKEAVAIAETITIAEAMSVRISTIAAAHAMAVAVIARLGGVIRQRVAMNAQTAQQALPAGNTGISLTGATTTTTICGSSRLLGRILRQAHGGQCKGQAQRCRATDE
jgi:hypothetical protein